MIRSLRPPPRPRNRLLARLPADQYERLLPRLERVEMERGDLMYDFDAPIEYAYFPESLISSCVHPLTDSSAVESTTVGNEGVVGIALLLGTDRMAAQEFCQVSGEALRISASDFLKLAQTEPFRTLSLRYVQAVLTQTALTAVCNGAHDIERRCARWLLHCQDRVQEDEIALTQDYLGHMLGVRRASVNEVMRRFEDAGIVASSYGRIRILDRAGLERRVCECYRVITREYERLVEGHALPNPLAHVHTRDGSKSALTPPQQARQPG